MMEVESSFEFLKPARAAVKVVGSHFELEHSALGQVPHENIGKSVSIFPVSPVRSKALSLCLVLDHNIKRFFVLST